MARRTFSSTDKSIKKSMGKTKSKRKKIISTIVAVIALILIISVFILYKFVFMPNVNTEKFYLYIPTNASYSQVIDSLKVNNVLTDLNSFKKFTSFKKYDTKLKSGKYLLKKGMSNRQIINMLISGNQIPVNLTFNNIRTNQQLAGKLSKQIEIDSIKLIKYLNDESFTKKYNSKPADIKLIFIPNTYKVFWNISAETLFDRMFHEYKKFWNEQRIEKAKNVGITPKEVGILASIVEEETNKNDEKPIIASVYLNRLRKDMLLQADPTVKYAVGDFGLRRILNKHLKFDSPYNTYIYKGLPPGPICIPSISSIDAVLENKHTKYLYFCAKDDFSGYHNFAATAQEHIANARKYQRALNKLKIY